MPIIMLSYDITIALYKRRLNKTIYITINDKYLFINLIYRMIQTIRATHLKTRKTVIWKQTTYVFYKLSMLYGMVILSTFGSDRKSPISSRNRKLKILPFNRAQPIYKTYIVARGVYTTPQYNFQRLLVLCKYKLNATWFGKDY